MTTTAKAAEVIRLLVEGGMPHEEALKLVTDALKSANEYVKKPVMKGEMK